MCLPLKIISRLKTSLDILMHLIAVIYSCFPMIILFLWLNLIGIKTYIFWLSLTANPDSSMFYILWLL
jgi:hypothetical protein